MSTYDVRSNTEEVIDKIVFADKSSHHGAQAHCVMLSDSGYDVMYIKDCACNQVAINSKEHALNLIKALNKAIELGWIE